MADDKKEKAPKDKGAAKDKGGKEGAEKKPRAAGAPAMRADRPASAK